MSVKTIFATPLTDNSATQKEELGILRFESDGKVYRYVQNTATQDATIGQVLRYVAVDGTYTVTTDYETEFAASTQRAAGVAIGTISASYYGWIQVSGFCSCVAGDNAIAAGNYLIPNVNTDAIADAGTVGTNDGKFFGVALTAPSTISGVSNAVAAQLFNMI